MKIVIEITVHDLLVFGEVHGREINSTTVATNALNVTKHKYKKLIDDLRQNILSDALDIARLTDTNKRGPKK